MSQVVPIISKYLLTHEQSIQASIQHSNDHGPERSGNITAFAQIVGQDWTYFVHKTHVNIGRASDMPDDAESEDDDYVHIDLGPSKMVSRQHAVIQYENDDQHRGQWVVKVLGRNGVKINGTMLRKGTQQALESGMVLEIGGVEMIYFLPPGIPFKIHPTYLRRAGLSEDDFPSPVHDTRSIQSSAAARDISLSQATAAGRARAAPGQAFQQPIAPAPPGHKRPGTPTSAKDVAKQTPQSTRNNGTIVMDPSGLDLSLDENHEIKPQYSYSQMITQAILSTDEERLNLSGIYTYITAHYAYYRHQPQNGWQNSIRHNLSLSKAFEKVARGNAEPGKGMKWKMTTESREELVRNAYRIGRGGHRGSSNPLSSPAQLSYSVQGPREMAARGQGSSRKRKASSPDSPQLRSTLRNSQVTPDRSSRHLDSEDNAVPGDGSPLPRLRKSSAGAEVSRDEATCSPVLTSSYGQEEGLGGSFVTPAPHRVHPKLAPPSTAQRPSQHMPTSSPAQFWKYAEISGTPFKSPSKNLGTIPQSSSPPASPTKNGHAEAEDAVDHEEPEEDAPIDLTK